MSNKWVNANNKMNKGCNMHQWHYLLDWFKSHVTNSNISRLFFGWQSLFTQKKENAVVHILNSAISAIPVYRNKILQHTLACFWLKNGRHIIAEYGPYNEHNNNNPYNTQIFYWKKNEYGLRMYEDPKDLFFTVNDWIEVTFNDRHLNFNQIMDIMCAYGNYAANNYKILDFNCQRFCQNLIY